MLNIKKVALSCALLIGLNAGSAQAQDCGEVTITEMDWGSAIIVTQVAKFCLSKGMAARLPLCLLLPYQPLLRLVRLVSLI